MMLLLLIVSTILLPDLVIAATVSISTSTSRRRLEYGMIAGYQPTTSVTDVVRNRFSQPRGRNGNIISRRNFGTMVLSQNQKGICFALLCFALLLFAIFAILTSCLFFLLRIVLTLIRMPSYKIWH